MGSSMYITLGRIKPRDPTQTAAEETTLITGGGEPVTYAQLEFLNLDDAERDDPENYKDPGHNYNFIGWMGCTGRGNLAPLLDETATDALEDRTDELVEWLEDEHHEMEEATVALHRREDFTEKYLRHYFGRRIYPLAVLQAFNYDQQVEVRPECQEDLTPEPWLERKAFFAGKTYRGVFPPEWFEFLQWTLEKKWDFMLVSFSD